MGGPPMLKPSYIVLPTKESQPRRTFPDFVIKTGINDFHPKIGDRLTFPSHHSCIHSSCTVWHEAEVTSLAFPFPRHLPPIRLLSTHSSSYCSHAWVYASETFQFCSSVTLDYLRGHLRERIAHAKRTGRSMIGQNTHSIPTEIEKITVSYWPGGEKKRKNNGAVQDGGAAGWCL